MTRMVQKGMIHKLADLMNTQEWAFRVQLSGERLQHDGIEFNSSLKNSQSDLGEKMENEQIHFGNNSKVNADVYYFVLSLANYIKALNKLPKKLQIERFLGIKTEIVSIRNIREHWEDNNLEKLITRNLTDRSKKNFKVFQNRAKDFPVLPFLLSISKNGDVTIADSIKVVWVLEMILLNNKIIEEFRL